MIAMQAPTQAPNVARKFDSLTALLGSDLERVEFAIDEMVGPFRGHFPQIIDNLAAYKGKRLRPVLTLLTAHALQLGVRPHHHLAGAIVELIHTATLIHDDVLDDADVRRSTATMHTRWGNKSSILLGDLLFSTAYHQASKTGDPKIGEMIGAATTRVCLGEMRQSLGGDAWELAEDDYYKIIDGKTAALTECACRLAGHISHSKPETIDRLATFGRELGLAFQIADDLLDIAGNAKATGKTLGTDLAQKKATLPTIRFLRQADARELAIFQEHCTDRRVVLELFRRTGIVEQIRTVMDGHIAEAKRALQCLPATVYRTALAQIADWCGAREH